MTRTWVLDLDNTMYSAESGLLARVSERILDYVVSRLGIPEEEGKELSRSYWQTYGLTMAGLMANHGIDPDEYMAYVFDVPLSEMLRPDPLLARALDRLPGRKVIFTNGSHAHARAVLSYLGIADCVGEIYDIRFMEYVPKPRPHGYRRLLAALRADPGECWMADDQIENLNTARSLGMTTVLVGPEPVPPHLHVTAARELVNLGL